jgi:TRAP-type C4-dicarboxylate transport system substrate-binding protein
MQRMKAAGNEIIPIADKKPFQDAVKPVWDKYGAKYADLIKQIQASELSRAGAAGGA